MKILLSCLLVASALVSSAQDSWVHNTVDEMAATLKACGPATTLPQKSLAKQGVHAIQREIDYPQIDFVFMKTDEDAWSMTGAFRHKSDYPTLSKDEASSLMPCVGGVTYSNKLFQPDTAPRPAPAQVHSDAGGGAAFAVFGVLVFIGGVIYSFYWTGQRRLRLRRPARLCLACRTTVQPIQNKLGQLFCPICAAPNPVPTSSPAAQEYYARTVPPPAPSFFDASKH